MDFIWFWYGTWPTISNLYDAIYCLSIVLSMGNWYKLCKNSYHFYVWKWSIWAMGMVWDDCHAKEWYGNSMGALISPIPNPCLWERSKSILLKDEKGNVQVEMDCLKTTSDLYPQIIQWSQTLCFWAKDIWWTKNRSKPQTVWCYPGSNWIWLKRLRFNLVLKHDFLSCSDFKPE